MGRCAALLGLTLLAYVLLEPHIGSYAACGSIQVAQCRYLKDSGGTTVPHHGSLRRETNPQTRRGDPWTEKWGS